MLVAIRGTKEESLKISGFLLAPAARANMARGIVGAEIGAFPFHLIARDNCRRFGLRCICIVEEICQ